MNNDHEDVLNYLLTSTHLCRNHYKGLRSSFESLLPLSDVRPTTEPLILIAFLPFVPKSGKRTLALDMFAGASYGSNFIELLITRNKGEHVC